MRCQFNLSVSTGKQLSRSAFRSRLVPREASCSPSSAVCSAQVHPTLCNPMDCSRSGSSVHGILQARILEWLPFPPPGDVPNAGIEPTFPTLAHGFFIIWSTREAPHQASNLPDVEQARVGPSASSIRPAPEGPGQWDGNRRPLTGLPQPQWVCSPPGTTAGLKNSAEITSLIGVSPSTGFPSYPEQELVGMEANPGGWRHNPLNLGLSTLGEHRAAQQVQQRQRAEPAQTVHACECSVAPLCPTLCDTMDHSLPGSSVHGILRARILPCPPPGDLPKPRGQNKPVSLLSSALAGGFFTTNVTWEAHRDRQQLPNPELLEHSTEKAAQTVVFPKLKHTALF